MGEVYRATDTNLKRAVAIKVLPASVAADGERIARFQREAEVLASLNHPNIAAVYGLERADGMTALVIELVEGPTLADRLAQGPIPLDEVLAIAKQIAEALEAAHEQGVIHRDLKPANIKVRGDGTVKVLDFGLAKVLEQASMSANATVSPTITSPALMTGVGVLLGTAAYMSPEQARGKTVNKRADIWAFGCVLYEMVTGKRAFPGEDVTDTLAAVVKLEPDWDAVGTDIPSMVLQVLRVCLQKDPRQRAHAAGDVRLALEGAFETPAAPVTQSAIAQPLRRRASSLAAALMVGGLLVGLIAWSVWPTAAPAVVNRFTDRLPQGQFFRNSGQGAIALSRDGRHAVYNTGAGLYLRSLDALEGRLIPGTESPSGGPFFSPDGESVAYFEFNQLKRISINGGAAVVICPVTALFGASWSIDNTILLGQPKGVMRVSANGGAPELVIAAKEGERVAWPQLLPDGDSVLFSVTSASGPVLWDAAQIVVQSLSTGARKVLRSGHAARYVPTGHLVYAAGDALFAVGFDVARQEVNGGAVSIADGVAGPSGNPGFNTGALNYAVSDTGTLVYLRGRFETAGAPIPLSTLVWVDRKGREEDVKAPRQGYVYPRLSPDGSRIALEIRNAGTGDIWIWDVRRQNMRRLTFTPELEAGPAWSPDGRRLVWASGGPLNLYWQAADGTGAPERLTNSPNTQRPSSFTPDGQQLLVAEGTTGAGVQDLGMLPLKGDRRVTWLVKTKFSELNGEVSPDGRWLAYESDESGTFQIFVRPFPAVDQGQWQVSINGGREPLWARSGRELFYVAPDGALMGVSIDAPQSGASLAAGTPATVSGGSGYFTGVANQLGRTYDVSADGARFLRIKIAGGSDEASAPPDLVVVTNWFEELKRLVPTN
jgi:serine/threonine-protein kinase